jgi:uncharacterized protein (DUF2062 family)
MSARQSAFSRFVRRAVVKTVGAMPRRLRGLHNLNGTPHKVALGFAVGVFVASTPILGVQILAAVALSWMLGGNLVAAVAGTFWANPLTYPVILVVSYEVGSRILGVDAPVSPEHLALAVDRIRSVVGALGAEAMSLEAVMAAPGLLWPILKPVGVGAVPVGLTSAVIFYYLSRRTVETMRVRQAA